MRRARLIFLSVLAFPAALVLFAMPASAAGGGTCTTTAWTDQGCGTGGCSQYLMYQTRTATPAGCAVTARCASSAICCSCGAWSPGACGAGDCAPTQRQQTRSCTPSACSAQTTCTNDTACGYVAPVNPWVSYGFVQPGDADYGFGAVTNATGGPLYPPLNTNDLVGFAAKGNIVLGDYTSPGFQTDVLPKANGAPTSETGPYAIDASDAALGYQSYTDPVTGKPMFNGNYTVQDLETGDYSNMPWGGAAQGDPAVRPDGAGGVVSRKFYEATLSDADFQALVNGPLGMPPANAAVTQVIFDGVLFTNHALLGLVNKSIRFNGSMVGRDEVVLSNGASIEINHDQRLSSGVVPAEAVSLPFAFQRPQLTRWQACSQSGCP